MDMHNSYVNTLSSYGFNDKDYFETYPEERRKWRKAIKQHVDDAMGITDEEIMNGDNMTKRLDDAHEDINRNVDNRTIEIKQHVDDKTIEIKQHVTDEVDDVQEVVNKINTHLGNITANKTIVDRLKEIHSDVEHILHPNHGSVLNPDPWTHDLN